MIEVPVECPHDARVMPAKKRRDAREKRRQPVRFDRRRGLGRRVKELTALFVGELGGPVALTPTAMLAVESAAELMTAAEAARARYLRGDQSVTLAHLVRIENSAARAVARLGIDGKRSPKGRAPSGLAEFLAKRSENGSSG